MKRNTYKQAVFAFGAPAILLIVACSQIYLAQVYQLSQWKRGGFGMFSTVDSPGARFLRIYLETPSGRIPIEPPIGLQTLAREVRTIPTPDRISRLAIQLAQATWVPYDYDPFGKGGASSGQDLSVQLNELTSTNDNAQKHNTSLIADEQPSEISTSSDHPLYRPLRPGEPSPANVVTVNGVHVELWRFIFDARNLQIKAQKYLEHTTSAGMTQK